MVHSSHGMPFFGYSPIDAVLLHRCQSCLILPSPAVQFLCFTIEFLCLTVKFLSRRHTLSHFALCCSCGRISLPRHHIPLPHCHIPLPRCSAIIVIMIITLAFPTTFFFVSIRVMHTASLSTLPMHTTSPFEAVNDFGSSIHEFKLP